jgi:hypothetical protein
MELAYNLLSQNAVGSVRLLNLAWCGMSNNNMVDARMSDMAPNFAAEWFMLFMSIGWDHGSELRPLVSLLLIPQVIYEYGQA